ncbi:unnamed protein product [Polarella glacialis]|uniref:Uncharacterized protein n=1 Tax=Polarella glacialis TaxID=89957 RepID=A0A813LTI9_POLGL|nr:unnamed protein product [Polarella glacialis]CAE8738298.1 unnamed protein product [Polarella glacialis]
MPGNVTWADGGKKKGKDGTATGLSKTPHRKTTILPRKNHPLLDQWDIKAKPARTLEDWFAAGLHISGDDDEAYVEGALKLPDGYTGCDKSGITVFWPLAELCIWPICLDFGEDNDGGPLRTLYHYTHKKSFDNFASIVQGAQAESKSDYLVHLMKQLQDDYQERVPRPTTTNRKGEPELLEASPSAFDSNREVLLALFDDNVPTGFSLLGTKFDTFAQCCVAFQVSASVCLTVLSGHPKGAAMRLDKQALAKLNKLAEQRRDHEQKKKEAEAERKKRERKAASWGCLGRLCSGNTEAMPEYWDELEAGDPAEDTRVKRDRREIDKRVEQLSQNFYKEHFANQRQLQVEAEKKEKAEKAQLKPERAETLKKTALERQFAAIPATATRIIVAEEEVKKRKVAKNDLTDPRVSGKMVNPMDMVASFGKKAADKIAQKGEQVDKAALQLYNDYKNKELEPDDHIAPMTRMKNRVGVMKDRLTKAPSGTKGGASTTSFGNAEIQDAFEAKEDEPGKKIKGQPDEEGQAEVAVQDIGPVTDEDGSNSDKKSGNKTKSVTIYSPKAVEK